MTNQELQNEIERLKGELAACQEFIIHQYVGLAGLFKLQGAESLGPLIKGLEAINPPRDNGSSALRGFLSFKKEILRGLKVRGRQLGLNR